MSLASPGPPGPAERISRPGRWMRKRFALGAVVVVALTAAATATAALLEVHLLVGDAKGPTFDTGSGLISDAAPGGPQTILILGSDRRYIDTIDHKPSRSDTILLVHLDAGASATTVMSIPRDLRTRIYDPHLHRTVTDKINSAYSRGGPALTASTIKSLLGIDINHIVNINFGGFREAVDYLGCVYTDVDRRYYNPPNDGYATIDVSAGYQKLCGTKALEYVRYRHGDTDIVRNARQQSFLRDIKDQVGTTTLLADREHLARIFGRYTQTDPRLRSFGEVLRLLDLVVDSSGHPVTQVPYPVRIGASYVYGIPDADRRAVAEFLHPQTSTPVGGNHRKPGLAPAGPRPAGPPPPAGIPGVVDADAAGRAQADQLGPMSIPVYYPTLSTTKAQYLPPRRYAIFDRHGRRHAAYRIVVASAGLGQYYGVQGTSWLAPPILSEPHDTRRIGGRTFRLYYDGHHLRLAAWRQGNAVYWVTNTLSETIGNRQLEAIAASLRRG